MAMNVIAAAGLEVALLAVVFAAGDPVAEASCGDVTKAVAACVDYVTGKAAAPSAECCGGVRALNAQASTKAARRGACGCLKQAVGQNGAIKEELVSVVPAKCSVSIPFRFSAKADCNSIP